MQRGDHDRTAGLGQVALARRAAPADRDPGPAGARPDGRPNPSPSAATITRYFSASSCRSRVTNPAPSPTTGPQPGRLDHRRVRATPAPSRCSRMTCGRRGRGSRPAGGRGRRAGGGRWCRRRGPTSTPACGRGRPLRPADRGPDPRIRRGSTNTTLALGGNTSVRSCSSSTSQGSQLSMPSNSAPSANRSHCSRPHGSSPTRRAARARTASVGITSRAGKTQTSARSSVERWSLTPKRVSRSTSSPHRSMRTGASAVDGKTSTMAPRRANSPRCSTSSSRRYPNVTSWAAKRVGVHDVARPHDDRLDHGGVGAEPLQQRSNGGDHHQRCPLGVAQPPQHLQASAHRLDRRADPLERQGLPAGELHHRVVREELGEVVGQLPGHRARRAGDHQRTAARQGRQRRQRDRACDLDHRQAGVGLAQGAGQPRFITEQRGEIDEPHGSCEGSGADRLSPRGSSAASWSSWSAAASWWRRWSAAAVWSGAAAWSAGGCVVCGGRVVAAAVGAGGAGVVTTVVGVVVAPGSWSTWWWCSSGRSSPTSPDWSPYTSGSCSPSQTYTASPMSISPKYVAEIELGMRMQPCDAG